jgi:hypothetical protein
VSQKGGVFVVYPTQSFMNIKNKIYKIIIEEIREFAPSNLLKKSTLQNLSSAVKKRIDELEDNNGLGYKHSTDENSKGNSKGIKKSKGDC